LSERTGNPRNPETGPDIPTVYFFGENDVIGALAVWRQNIKNKMFLELFCDVLHNERPDFDFGCVAAALVESPQQYVEIT